MEKNQDLQYQKNKLHIKYIISIALLFVVASIILSGHDKAEFVSEVSFASTITSIVLSVLAIWMSMSGERATNDIRNEIVRAADKLYGTTEKVENLNKKYEDTMNVQLEELRSVQNNLFTLHDSISNVREQVAATHEELAGISLHANQGANNINSDKLINIFDSVFSWLFTTENLQLKWIFCKMVWLTIEGFSKQRVIAFNEYTNGLMNENVMVGQFIGAINVDWGVINTLIAVGVFNEKTVVDHILVKINEVLKNKPF